MVKFKMFGDTSSKAYYEDFNHQIKLVKDEVLTLEEAIKLLERGCSNEMQDKCKIISELDKEAKSYEDKLRQYNEKDLFIGPNNINIGQFSKIIENIRKATKSSSELLINIKDKKIPKELIKELVKLIEIDENISRNIYLTLKKIEELDKNNTNKLLTKIQKSQKEAEVTSSILLDNFEKYNAEKELPDDLKQIIDLLKNIPIEAGKVALIIN